MEVEERKGRRGKEGLGSGWARQADWEKFFRDLGVPVEVVSSRRGKVPEAWLRLR